MGMGYSVSYLNLFKFKGEGEEDNSTNSFVSFINCNYIRASSLLFIFLTVQKKKIPSINST